MEFNKDTFVKVNGLFDIEASLTNVAAALASANELYSNDAEAVGAAVSSVFDQYKGAFVQMPALVTLTVGKLNLTTIDSINAMSERVKDYIGANSGEGGLYDVRKGRGVGRVTDVPVRGEKIAK
jgi:hypothetical protein